MSHVRKITLDLVIILLSMFLPYKTIEMLFALFSGIYHGRSYREAFGQKLKIGEKFRPRDIDREVGRYISPLWDLAEERNKVVRFFANYIFREPSLVTIYYLSLPMMPQPIQCPMKNESIL